MTARALAEHVVALPWPEALARAASAELRSHALADVPARLLERAVDGAEWLVVVDGLDEVPGDERERLLDCLSTWTASEPDRAARPYRLLVTTRPLAGHATALLGGGAVGHYTLVPFDRAALEEFARRWFEADGGDPDPDGADLAAGFLAEVDAAGLEELTAVPLLATIAINLYQADRTLPRNRHDLYDQCLTLLRATGRERREAARRDLARDLADLPAGPGLVDTLFDHLDEILEHLAIVRVTSRRPLPPVALDWLRHRVLATASPPPVNWGARVVNALITTGLLSRPGTGLDFIHLSFAEHLAARAYARELPAAFTPDDAGWRRWSHGAVQQDPVAMAVLTRWSREQHAEPLLDWLLAGGTRYQMTAVRLIAEEPPPRWRSSRARWPPSELPSGAVAGFGWTARSHWPGASQPALHYAPGWPTC
ncbi:NACHT domain-containing protein [Phytohabitans flavus]|uniref:NACHT domain-containing protein n=1 Tax=Phytohabitans flavus TaxID=1076124 RepID=UPI003627674F